MPPWVARYIGVPFVEHGRDPVTGWDCWGLVRHIWARHFGIDLPSYAEAYASALELADVADVIAARRPVTAFQPVVAPLLGGDGLLFRIEGHAAHVGILVAGSKFLHVDRGPGTVLDDLTAPRWSRRFLQAYRWMPSTS